MVVVLGDADELVNLIDSSLDFWFTAGPWAHNLWSDQSLLSGLRKDDFSTKSKGLFCVLK